MKILSIDMGSYSIKFLELKLEKKKLTLLDNHEVVIDHVREQFSEDQSLQQIQMDIIHNYIQDGPGDFKIIYQLPIDMITTRFLDVPVANKKKAEMMIPFQLEENLPYPSSSIHYIANLKKAGDHTSAVINITQHEVFEGFYNNMERREVLPAILTSEILAIQNFIELQQMRGPICIIDLGHQTTKTYFAIDGLIVSNHTSHVAGHLVDEVIAKTYQISDEEAVVYKHQNCFLLTENQYEEVDQDQQEFAKLMQQTFWPLVLDIKRWELGFRVKHGTPIEKVFLLGGTSNIHNIENFLSQAFSLPVEHIDPINQVVQKDISFDDQEGNDHYNMSFLLANTQLAKSSPGNFLTGNYASGFSQNIPFHSTAFILTRAMILAAVFIASLLVERFVFLNRDQKALDRQITKIYKRKDLNLSRRQTRNFKRKPERALSFFKKKNRTINQEVKTIMSATRINAIGPLAKLSQSLTSNKNINLDSFHSDGNFSEAQFSSKSQKELEKMEGYLKKSSQFNNAKIDYDKKKNVLKLVFEGI